jgi:NADH-quinone oxidoreductase subunit L
LVILSGAAIVGGAINLPVISDWLVLEHFLEPVFEHGELHHFTSGTGTKVALAVVAVIAGALGIAFAVAAWLKGRVSTAKLEPAFLENAMYVDATYAKVVGGPGHKMFDLVAAGDDKLVDGAVNGVGRLVQRIGLLIQPAQSGYIRQYAIGVILGAIALIVWLLTGAV